MQLLYIETSTQAAARNSAQQSTSATMTGEGGGVARPPPQTLICVNDTRKKMKLKDARNIVVVKFKLNKILLTFSFVCAIGGST